MKNELEKVHGSNPQDTVDAANDDTRGRSEGSESTKGCQSERDERRGQASCEDDNAELEERFRKECRKSCRRNFWIELLKTASKIAGVVLAAFGLSSFNEED